MSPRSIGFPVGPGRCMGCAGTVWWSGKRWRNEGQRSGRHICPTDRPECGAFMPQARERCARRPGHKGSCRSRWVMDDAARRRRGQGYCGSWDNTGVGSSDESNTIANGTRVLATTHDAGVTAFRGSSS